MLDFYVRIKLASPDDLGTNYIADYVISLVHEEGFGIRSAIAQFESNF